MKYEDFKNSLDETVFTQDLNYKLLETVIKNPQRYIGIFRITNAKTKLIQNLTQSCEIKFGKFMEDILRHYIKDMSYENLSNTIKANDKTLNLDQVFRKNNIIYFIEQKIRDDHDSSKKHGQYSNFINKIKALKLTYPNKHIKACMWFSDETLKKNKKFYLEQINNNTDDIVEINLFYGKELFENLFNRVDVYDELISHLRRHKEKKEAKKYFVCQILILAMK